MSASTLVENAVVNAEKAKASRKIQAGRFEGSFKLFGANWFRDLKFYGFSPEVSHKICMDGISNLGLAMSRDASLDAKIKKANKNKESGFKIGGSSGLVAMHNSMGLIRLVQTIDALRSEGLFHEKEFLKLSSMEGHLNPEFVEYLRESEEWAKTQTWEE